MSHTLQLPIKETIAQLKELHKRQPHHLKQRVQMLLLIKQAKVLSKRALADALGVNPNSIHNWRTKYSKQGLSGLLEFKRTSYKQAAIHGKVRTAVELRLKSPTDAFTSYSQLQQWLKEKFGITMRYQALYIYVKRHYQTKLKVARKSHLKKDERAVKAFKKNSSTAERTH